MGTVTNVRFVFLAYMRRFGYGGNSQQIWDMGKRTHVHHCCIYLNKKHKGPILSVEDDILDFFRVLKQVFEVLSEMSLKSNDQILIISHISSRLNWKFQWGYL